MRRLWLSILATVPPVAPPHPENSAPCGAAELAPVRRSHSFFSVAAFTMACLSVGWLLYVTFVRARYHWGGPFWQALYDNEGWPGGLSVILAIVGAFQTGRKR